MVKLKIAAAAALTVLNFSSPAMATAIFATSYDMPNGIGQSSGGNFNYWDLAYSGTGLTNVDGAPLSGGLGDLTDGFIASGPWFTTENAAGTGPYVGWSHTNTPDPLITFNFASLPTINTISIHMDNSLAGGVVAPASILVDGVAQAFISPVSGTIGTVVLTGLNLTGTRHTIQFLQTQGTLTFVSEISFDGTAGVPEPATWAMMIIGFGAAGSMIRRRKALIA